jgi:hypothetical protein
MLALPLTGQRTPYPVFPQQTTTNKQFKMLSILAILSFLPSQDPCHEKRKPQKYIEKASTSQSPSVEFLIFFIGVSFCPVISGAI